MKKINIHLIESCGYQILCDGTVIGSKSGRPLKPEVTHDGYLKVTIVISGKKQTYRVHRLVAAKFIPARTGREEVNHKDGIRSNNNSANLEWVSREENNFHKAHGSWNNRSSTLLECRHLIDSGMTMADIANRLGISGSTVHRWTRS